MLQRTSLVLVSCLFSLQLVAQKPTTAPKVQLNPQPALNAPKPMPVAKPISYKKLNSGLEYAFITDKPTSPRPQEGDLIKVNMQSACNNRMLYSTSQVNKGKPAEFSVNKPNFKGDLIEAIMLMTPGDSLVCLVDADALFKSTKNKMPDFIKKGDKVQYFVKLVSIKTKDQMQKEQQAAFNKQIQDQMAKQKKEAAKILAKEEKELQAYFTKNNIQPTKTSSGLYYIIKEEGIGEQPKVGDSVTMNYTGTLIDGTKFDSNVDSAFNHVQPFQFQLGKGQVIKGWDEGVALLKTGSKATLYIPSPMAYGAQSRPGGGANPKGIPANSILLFDVELVGFKTPAPAPVAPSTNTPTENTTPQTQNK
ncbi:MAG TPA: FKBP-type peptidyl-prolyl cis-trans isomerase [Chitinophagaceae bacterium]|jgi:FKBP-type peptidyl-prolyl cis-trans isomerase FkpA|nr:FKBP-type peptidyl-prolyl cis-trans isomerase [Chitinophagaceae bacterium]